MGKERGIYKFPLHLAIIFLLLSIGICISGYLYYEKQKQHFKKEIQNELSAIADLKVKQIVNWRENRLGDAETIFNNPLIVPHIRQWLKSGPYDIKQEILIWMRSLQEHYHYKSIIILDTKGNIRLAFPDGKEILGQDAKRFAREAINTKKVIFSDLYRRKTTNVIRLTLVIPLLVSKGRDNIPVGVLLLRIDPYQFLYPLIQSWPTPSETAESLIIRTEGNEIVFLSKLRHQKNAALNLRFPVVEKNLPAAMVARGIEGVVEGIDYRGSPVIAHVRPVPNTPWLLVAKMDISEVSTPLREELWEVVFLMGALLICAGASIGFVWRHHAAESYRKQYETEHERQMYAQRYEYLTKYANDIILLADRDGQIKDFNKRAVAAYGYSGDELLQKNLKDLRAPETKAFLNGQIKEVEEHNGLVFETLHQRKDGTTFPIEVSSRIIQIDGNKYYQSIIRNITERKQAEEKINHLNLLLRAIRNVNQFITRGLDRYQLIQVACKSFVEMHGYRSAWIALLDDSAKLITSAEAGVGEHFSSIVKQLEQGDLPQCDLKALRESGVVRFDENRAECRQCPLADMYPGSSSMTARLEYGGKIYGFITVSVPLALAIDEEEMNLFREVSDDIAFALNNLDVQADKKKAEEALRESGQRFRAIFDNAADGILIADVEDKKFHSGNSMICKMLGYTEEEIKNLGLMDIHPEKDIPYVSEQFKKQASGKITLAQDIPVKRKDGSVFYADINSFTITLAGKTYLVGIFRDITDRKKFKDKLEKREAELKERVKQLEDFYDMSVGRELKMKELKEEIEILKDELAKYRKEKDI